MASLPSNSRRPSLFRRIAVNVPELRARRPASFRVPTTPVRQLRSTALVQPPPASSGKVEERAGVFAKRVLPFRVFARAARSSLGLSPCGRARPATLDAPRSWS
jgi:hypothetical protein